MQEDVSREGARLGDGDGREGDIEEIQGKHWGDIGEIQGRYGGDMGEIGGRYRGPGRRAARLPRARVRVRVRVRVKS